MNQLPVCICCHDDWYHLRVTLRSFANGGPAIVFVSRLAWDGSPGDVSKTIEIATDAGAEVVVGDWPSENAHRRASLEAMKERGHGLILIPDSDEVISPELLDALLRLSKAGITDLVRVRMATYFKSPRYVIRPAEQLAPILMLDCRTAEHLRIREYSGEKPLVLGEEHGVLHHLSYVGSDSRILRKISTWGHKHELIPKWYEEKWKGWDQDRFLNNLHPTHPQCYGFTERIPLPDVLEGTQDPVSETADPEINFKWPKLSIVVPLYGGPEDIAACLESLQRCQSPETPFEIIVVDDASPDEAASIVEGFPDAQLIRSERNEGFAATCNKGFRASTGEIILCLNSDTRVPRAALIRLMETICQSGMIAVAGPYTNAAGYHQPFSPTYTTVENLDNFARDFADRDTPDVQVSMLVGFCLAIRRSVLDEVGMFDTAFTKGLYEDTDLLHRVQRAGYRAMLSTRSYVHHEGSRSLNRLTVSPEYLLEQNRRIFEAKWKEDLETGFASHLAGQKAGLISFNPDREPEKLRQALRRKARNANISLCMIVKDEERVLGDCLKSVRGLFNQIVIVDTGSKDRTIEIAKSFGAEVYEMEWPDSFSVARNESLKYSNGDWNMFMDADDTMPLSSAEEIVDAVLNAPPDQLAWRMRVQFVENGPYGGTRVDHLKLWRNHPAIRFEGHIHEQNLASVRRFGGRIDLIQGLIYHSGYDNSPEGQRKKAKRDKRLLYLDYLSDPNFPFYTFNLGMTAFYRHRYKVAIAWLKRSIRQSSPGDSIVRKSFALLARSQQALGRPKEAMGTCMEGLKHVGEDGELRFILAELFIGTGRAEEALFQLDSIETSSDGYLASVDIGIFTYRRQALYADAQAALGNFSEAKERLAASIKANPFFLPAIVTLFQIGMQTQDPKAVRAAISALLAVEGPSQTWVEWELALATLFEIPAAEALNNLIRKYPEAAAPRIVLSESLLQSGQQEAAIPLLQSLAARGSASSCFNLGIVAFNRGDFEEAYRLTERAVKLDPANPLYASQIEALVTSLQREELSKLEGNRNKEHLYGPRQDNPGIQSCNLTVVVVTHNSAETIRPCVQAALQELAPNDEVILVDNDSSDGTIAVLERLGRQYSQVKVILNGSNVGYAPACNQGIRAGTGKFIVTLNPDAILAPGCLQSLLEPLKDEVAATGPLADNTGGDQFVGFHIGEARPALADLPAFLATTKLGQTQETKLLMGFCLALRRDILNEVGLLCEETELGADDLELCWRLRELGYELKIVPSAFVFHKSGHSFQNSPTKDMAKVRIRRSDRALVNKLTTYYGWNTLPTSQELWGCNIFDEAYARVGKSFARLALAAFQ